MRTCTLSLTVALFILGSASLRAQADFQKLMITEVSWGEPDGLEITNFSLSSIVLSGWTIVWNDGVASTSMPLSGTVGPGSSAIITEPTGTSIPELPLGTLNLQALPSLNTSNGALIVTLRNSVGTVIDEVRISSTSGVNSLIGLGTFRGLAIRGSLPGSVCVERIHGLDSDGGSDWSEEVVRSFGLENRSSGPRGSDPIAVPSIRITEIDDNPDYLEIFNSGSTSVSLHDWLILRSSSQGSVFTRIALYSGPAAPSIGPGAYRVFGNNATMPAELPASVGYTDLSIHGSGILSFGTQEFEIALYDSLGRLLDCVRTSGHDDEVVHNAPRAPSAPDSFLGAALRSGTLGVTSMGRRVSGSGNYLSAPYGSNFQACFTRTLGALNTDFAGLPGFLTSLDARIHETTAPGGATIILNGGTGNSGKTYSIMFSVGHFAGAGPFFGLGGDALVNWLSILNTPPFAAPLDARGSARIDFPPGTFAAGFDLDAIFIIQEPTGTFVTRTPILEFDT